MPKRAQDPFDNFTTPVMRAALVVSALALVGLGLWFWLSEDEPLTGAAVMFVALVDVGILVAAQVRKRRAAEARAALGIIEPMENRPPT